MGPESKDDYTLYLDGVPIALVEIQLPEITLPADVPEREITPLLEPMEFTMQIKTPKHLRCRSRKRFIKLMMSDGITRNCAEQLADSTRKLMPYVEAWRNHLQRKWLLDYYEKIYRKQHLTRN